MGAEVRDQAQRQVSMGDRTAERPAGGAFRVVVRPVPVRDGPAERVHDVLGDLKPGRGSEVAALQGDQLRPLRRPQLPRLGPAWTSPPLSPPTVVRSAATCHAGAERSSPALTRLDGDGRRSYGRHHAADRRRPGDVPDLPPGAGPPPVRRVPPGRDRARAGAMEQYWMPYLAIADQHGVALRGRHRDVAGQPRLGRPARVRRRGTGRANEAAAGFARHLAGHVGQAVVNGVLGPRGDGYVAGVG